MVHLNVHIHVTVQSYPSPDTKRFRAVSDIEPERHQSFAHHPQKDTMHCINDNSIYQIE